MGNFWSLVLFEYKKIVKRKSFIFALIILVLMATLCTVGPVLLGTGSLNNKEAMSNLAIMGIQQLASHEEAGYLDDAMVNEVIEKNTIAMAAKDANEMFPDDIYDEYLLPYQGLRWNMISVFSPLNGDYNEFGNLTSGEGIDFYALRTAGLEERMRASNYPQAEIDATLSKNSKLSEPFYFDYFDGYSVFLSMMATSLVFVVFALAVCIAPIFSDEYQKKTDSIILSSRFGKNRLIVAKIFTVITFSFLFVMAALIIALVTLFSVYSTIGGNVSFQLFHIFTVYPLTMANAVLIYCLVTICVSFLIGALSAFLSAHFSSFATIVSMMALLIGSLFFHFPKQGLGTLNYFLPSKMLDSSYVFSDRLVNVFGLYVEPYIFIPILCFALIAIFLPLAYRGFKRHQAT